MAPFEKKRILTGIILALASVLFILYAPVPLFKIFIIFMIALCLREFMVLALPRHPSSSIGLGIILGVFLSAVLLFAKSGSNLWMGSLALVVMISFGYYLFCRHDLEMVLSQIAITVLGSMYISCLFSYIGLIRDLGNHQGAFWVFLAAGTTFMADTSAYFIGSLIGKHRLAPRVSPGKTVEGLIGGIGGSILAALICRALFWKGFTISSCVVLGALVGLVGPLGDLSESLIKRSMGVKDSGTLIPGHGGLLDRLDALLFTGPLVYYYALFFYY